MILLTFLFLTLASASDFYNLIGRTMIDIDRLRWENEVLKSTLNHYEQEYSLASIRWIQSENLQLLFKNDELERTVKNLRVELNAVKEKLSDLKNDELRCLMSLKAAKSCQFRKNNQNVSQQTETRMMEHEEFNVLEKYGQHFGAKLEKKKAIYKKTDEIKKLNFGRSSKCKMKERNLCRGKLKTEAVENSNDYAALVAKCKKHPISDKHFNELKYFLSVVEINKSNSFYHPGSDCWMKISDSDRLELYSNVTNKRIITFEMKLPVQVKISNEELLTDLQLPRETMFELQLIDFKDGAVEMYYLPSNQLVCVLGFRYKLLDSWKDFTMKKNEKPQSIHLVREWENHERAQIMVSHADLIVTYMEMDDFAHVIKRALEQQFK